MVLHKYSTTELQAVIVARRMDITVQQVLEMDILPKR